MSSRVRIKSFVLLVLGSAILLPVVAAEPAAAPATLSADSPEYKRGKLLFIQCRACHDLQVGKPHKVGPNLHGFVGRKAGTIEGFSFSAALKGSALTWDDATILQWLEKPSALVPGNTMAFAGIANPKDRNAMLVYLKAESQAAN
ncbi:MAG TPA: cytochrome c family protein [Steroidobacteraceae bacterium]|nr:cytochrome c family protein [Steroidobacteraceae bacterium]HRX88125.1 cytochrome c family protein [Steroidobacteraceae bacterium]